MNSPLAIVEGKAIPLLYRLYAVFFVMIYENNFNDTQS